MKRFLLVMAAALMGLSAMATDYDMYVFGRQVTDANKGDILGDGTCVIQIEASSDDSAHVILNNVNLPNPPAWADPNDKVFLRMASGTRRISKVVVEVYGHNQIGRLTTDLVPDESFEYIFKRDYDSQPTELVFVGNGELYGYAAESVIYTLGNSTLVLNGGFHYLESSNEAPINALNHLIIGDDYAAWLKCRTNAPDSHYTPIHYGTYQYHLMEEAADLSCTQHPFCYAYTINYKGGDVPYRYQRNRLNYHGVCLTYESACCNILGKNWYGYSPVRVWTHQTQIQGNSGVFLNHGRLTWNTLYQVFRESSYSGSLYWDIQEQCLMAYRGATVTALTYTNDEANIYICDNRTLVINEDLKFFRNLHVSGKGRLLVKGNLLCTGTSEHCIDSKLQLDDDIKLVVEGECNLRNTDIKTKSGGMTVQSGVLTGVNSIKLDGRTTKYLKGGVKIENGTAVSASGSSVAGQTIDLKPAENYPLMIGYERINETNYSVLSTLPGVTVAPGGYLRYNPVTKCLQMKDVTFTTSIYMDEDMTMEVTGTNHLQYINLRVYARNLTIIGQGSNQQSRINIAGHVVLENGGRVTFNNLSGNGPIVVSNSTDDYGSVDVQACSMTFPNNYTYTGINSFQWSDCYITPAAATFSSTNHYFESASGTRIWDGVQFTMQDGSKAPLAIEAYITGINIDLMGTAGPDGYAIPFDDHCTNLRLTKPGIYRVRTMCRLVGNGSTGASVRLAGETGSSTASYLGAGYAYEKSVVKYTASRQPTTYTASATAIGTSAPFDTVRSQPLRVEIPGQITVTGPLAYLVGDYNLVPWQYLAEGETQDVLVYAGDTVWAYATDACYPRISMAGSEREGVMYYSTGSHGYGNVTALRDKYDVTIWGDVAMTDRLQHNSVNCGDAIGNFWSDPSDKSEEDQFLGWALEGTTMPFYTHDEISAMVITASLNINAVFASDVRAVSEDDEPEDTAIDEIFMRNEQLKTEKIISNGHVYIVVDNVVYDITGQKQ